MNSHNGFLLIDKPKGLSSHDVVNRVRRLTGVKKVGHAGTLDPNATGLLVVAVGEATKFIQFLDDSTKEYEAEIIFGAETDTDDVTGEIITEAELPDSNTELLVDGLNSFLGESEQLPPKYSAKKIKGKKLYQYARNGEEVELKAHPIRVDEVVVTDTSEYPRRAEFRLKCSRGTYVRSLIRDLGRKLESTAHMGDLRRTHSGIFDIKNAIPLEELEEGFKDRLIPIEEGLAFYKSVIIKPEAEKNLLNGNRIYPEKISTNISELEPEELVTLFGESFYGMGLVLKDEHDRLYIQPKRLIKSK